MKTRNVLTASTAAFALSLVPMAQAQSLLQGNEILSDLNTACESGIELPQALDCGLVADAQQDPTLMPQVLEMTQQLRDDGVKLNKLVKSAAKAEANAEVETQAEAEVQPAPEAQAQADVQTDADVAAEAQAPVPAAPEAAPETAEQVPAPTAEENDALASELRNRLQQNAEGGQAAQEPAAPAPVAEPAPEADAGALAQALEETQQAQEAQTAEAAEQPAQEQPTAEATTDNEGGLLQNLTQQLRDGETAEQAQADSEATAEAEVQEPTEAEAQAQANAVSQADAQTSAAAAAASGEGSGDEPELIEETVQADDVRSSSEDFSTSVTQAPTAQATDQELKDAKAKARENGEDAERARTVAGAALLGLGAVALNEILSNNETVVSNSGDRVVIEDQNGQYRVLRNDDVLLRRPGADVATYRYDDGSTRNVVTYEDGTVVETIRAADGRVLRRARTLSDGTEVVLFDDTQATQEVVINDLPQVNDTPTRQRVVYRDGTDAEALARALAAEQTTKIDRVFSLNQVRNIEAVRHLVPEITVDTINFETNSAAIRPVEAEALAALGTAMKDAIARNPSEVFLVEGHTDAVGNYAYNLALSDRRAESVALALTEYFDVPPENMVLQGYGESDLVIPTTEAARENRRSAVRRITPLLQASN